MIRMKAVLLVIDMQNDFIKEGAIVEVGGIREKVPEFKEFVDKCREKGVKVVYTSHCYDPKKNVVEAKLFPELDEEGLRKSSEGWQIYDKIAPLEGEVVIDKERYDAFFKTELRKVLKSEKVDTVIITGTMTEICCESTARTAMSYDYDVVFCSDLTFTCDKDAHENTLKVIKNHFGKVKSSKEILGLL